MLTLGVEFRASLTIPLAYLSCSRCIEARSAGQHLPYCNNMEPEFLKAQDVFRSVSALLSQKVSAISSNFHEWLFRLNVEWLAPSYASLKPSQSTAHLVVRIAKFLVAVR
jgi:hypothetical protein